MWCPACRADVAAELSPDSRRYRCARCGAELGIAKGSLGAAVPGPAKPSDAERTARELLARWSAQSALHRVEKPEGFRHADRELPIAPPDEPADQETLPAVLLPAPAAVGDPQHARRPPFGVAIGQMCAYFGVGLITCGTSVVLWGYFGGPEHFAPTGWLITTIGQMFLFLGVVTLISSSLEQTSTEVASRFDSLAQRLIRIEALLQHQTLRPAPRRTGPQRTASPPDPEPPRRASEAA